MAAASSSRSSKRCAARALLRSRNPQLTCTPAGKPGGQRRAVCRDDVVRQPPDDGRVWVRPARESLPCRALALTEAATSCQQLRRAVLHGARCVLRCCAVPCNLTDAPRVTHAGTESQRGELLKQLHGRVLPLSLQMYGCRVIQKALEALGVEGQRALVEELEGHVLSCVHDQNGNHVVQKAIEYCPPELRRRFMAAFAGASLRLAQHPYGCRVVQVRRRPASCAWRHCTLATPHLTLGDAPCAAHPGALLMRRTGGDGPYGGHSGRRRAAGQGPIRAYCGCFAALSLGFSDMAAAAARRETTSYR
jgi:hypothetical protein